MRRPGFTIIELMVTVLIVGMLIAAGAVQITTARQSARDAHRLSDIFSIAKMIDQSVATNRGVYPRSAQNVADSTLCAHQLVGQNGENPSALDLTAFSAREIPKDLQPSIPDNNCSDYTKGFLHGYTYHTEYGHPNANNIQSGNLAAYQQVTYALEVGLERQKPDDEHILKSPSELGIATRFLDKDGSPSRFRYVLNGTFCGGTTGSSTKCYGP